MKHAVTSFLCCNYKFLFKTIIQIFIRIFFDISGKFIEQQKVVKYVFILIYALRTRFSTHNLRFKL